MMVLSVAKALNVTHIVESGRAGGLTLSHYAHFGFALSSIELFPVPHVAATLRAMLPSVRYIDDANGVSAVPAEVERMVRSHSTS